jgi:hypothetical protein
LGEAAVRPCFSIAYLDAGFGGFGADVLGVHALELGRQGAVGAGRLGAQVVLDGVFTGAQGATKKATRSSRTSMLSYQKVQSVMVSPASPRSVTSQPDGKASSMST